MKSDNRTMIAVQTRMYTHLEEKTMKSGIIASPMKKTTAIISAMKLGSSLD